jgi:hypothetical protein
MAGQKSKRRARKQRNPGASPRAVPSQRREQRAELDAAVAREQRQRKSRLDVRGERPSSPFGGLPVSELAIFAGAIALIVGWTQSGGPALIVGLVVCALGVLEVTAREHFSGYRSHSMLLAAFPAVGVEVALVATIGGKQTRAVALLGAVPVFAVAFWLLRKRFDAARQARVARPVTPARR